MSESLDKFCRLSVALPLTRKNYDFRMLASVEDVVVDLHVQRFYKNSFEHFFVVVKRASAEPCETEGYRREVNQLKKRFGVNCYLAVVGQDGKSMAVDYDLMKRMAYDPKRLLVNALGGPSVDHTPGR